MIKKILIFSLAYPPFVGGAELAIKEETDRIKSIEFDMITLRFNSNLPKFERIGNVNVHRIGFVKKGAEMKDLVKFPSKLNKILFPFIACRKAKKLHKERKYDGIWAMMAAYAGFAAMFFKLRNPKVLYLLTLQEGDPIDYILKKVRFVRPLFNRVFTKADYVQTISYYLAEFAQSMGFLGRLKVVPNAVDTKVFTQHFSKEELDKLKIEIGKKEGDVFIVHTGRFVLKNALDDIIRSLTYLPANVKFLLIGTGPDDDKLKQLVKDLKLENRVIFKGFIVQKEIVKFLKISDIFIRPSLSEGFGNSFIEAMAAEIPVIATPVGGIVDFLFDPKRNPDKEPTGLFCNVRDPKSIADQIDKFLNDHALRERIVKNAKKMVFEKYDWDIIARDMKEIFDNL